MPSPSGSLATLRPDLAGSFMEFDLEMQRRKYVAQRIMPVLEVPKQAGTFGIVPIEQLLQKRETKRAPGGGYNRSKFTFDDVSYACAEHGVEEPVDDREAKMYVDYFDAEEVATARAREAVLNEYEERVLDLVGSTSTWTGSALTTAAGTAWTATASATPIADVRGARLKVWEGSGLIANAMIISWNRFQHLKDCADIVDRIKSWGGDNPNSGSITEKMVAVALDLDEIIVVGAQENTADEGLAATVASIWTDSQAMVCRVARGRDIREPCIGRSFHWGEDGSSMGGLVESYRDETVRSDVIRNRMDTDEKVLYTQAGHLLTSV